MQKQLKMAQQGPPRTGLTHKASITDLVKDLELLRVDTKDYGETMDSMGRALDLRIEELKTNNGTLLEVCFSYDHFFLIIFFIEAYRYFVFLMFIKRPHFQIRTSPASSIIRALGQLLP